MIANMFSVFDSAAARFTEPWPAPTVEIAIRRFRHTVNQDGNDIAMFPEDYTLFHVGEFDQELGVFHAFDTPRSLGVAITFKDHAHGSQRELRLEASSDA